MSLLQMSFYGAVMILAVVAVRALTLHKLPKLTFLIMWYTVLARLLIPLEFPSVFSIYSLLGRLAPEKEQLKQITDGQIYYAAAPKTAEKISDFASVSASASVSDIDFELLVWLAGFLACAVFFSLVYFKCRREFRTSVPCENEYVNRWLKENKLCRPLSVRVFDRIFAPLTYGVFRPVILLPKSIDTADEEGLRFVLAHELVHIRRFDAAMKLLLTAAVCIHWFNPMVWIMYIIANRDMEISCDETVIFGFEGGAKADYSKALILMEERKSGFPALYSHFSKNAIEERIVAIMKMKKNICGCGGSGGCCGFGYRRCFCDFRRGTVGRKSVRR